MSNYDYTAPTQGTNELAGFTGFQPDPHFFNHKKDLAGIGEAVDFRILRLDKVATLVSPGRKCVLTNPKDNTPMNVTVYDPGEEVARTLFDRNGDCLASAKPSNIFRLTVWINGKHTNPDRDGNPTKYEPIKKLMYFEWGPGLVVDLNKLNSTQKGCSPFDKKTGRPNYDIQLSVVPGNTPSIKKNYKLTPILFNLDDNGIPVAHPNVGRQAEDVLKEHMDQIRKEWSTVVEAMRKTPTPDDIRRQFQRERQNSASTHASTRHNNSGFNRTTYGEASEDGGYSAPGGYSGGGPSFEDE